MRRIPPKIRALIIAAASLGIMVTGTYEYVRFHHELRKTEAREKMRESLLSRKSQLEKSLYSRIYYTKSIAAYISINPDITTATYDLLAGEYVANDSVINSMAMSRNCIICAIHPLAGHESAIGLDLLAHPKRRQMVENTIRSRKTFVAGPVELVEGGMAFISYTPVFTLERNEKSKFWGVTDIVILRDRLFREAGIVAGDANFVYGFQGEDGKGRAGSFFWGDSTVFALDPVMVEVSLPTGSWLFAGAPRAGWDGYLRGSDEPVGFLYLGSFLVALLIWLLARSLETIRANERQLKALFGSMSELIIEFDDTGVYRKIAPTNDSLLVRPKAQLLGKSMHEVFDKETADFFLDAIHRCIATRNLVVIDYPLRIGAVDFWFQARLSYISDSAVLYVAQDNTERKRTEEELRSSAMRLKELNATKDKFFSIIAHDLRSPFNAFLGYTEIMATELHSMTLDEVQGIATNMRRSAGALYRLLENLLEWSRIQRGLVKYAPRRMSLREAVDECLDMLGDKAMRKKVGIEIRFPEDMTIVADAMMFQSIIRNLLSNALKFSNEGGRVVVDALRDEDGTVVVSVADTGIGMSADLIGRLFELDQHVGRAGTANEPSSGLGLLLCREFVEKHGGRIWVESAEGKGTTFRFTIHADAVFEKEVEIL